MIESSYLIYDIYCCHYVLLGLFESMMPNNLIFSWGDCFSLTEGLIVDQVVTMS